MSLIDLSRILHEPAFFLKTKTNEKQQQQNEKKTILLTNKPTKTNKTPKHSTSDLLIRAQRKNIRAQRKTIRAQRKNIRAQTKEQGALQ